MTPIHRRTAQAACSRSRTLRRRSGPELRPPGRCRVRSSASASVTRFQHCSADTDAASNCRDRAAPPVDVDNAALYEVGFGRRQMSQPAVRSSDRYDSTTGDQKCRSLVAALIAIGHRPLYIAGETIYMSNSARSTRDAVRQISGAGFRRRNAAMLRGNPHVAVNLSTEPLRRSSSVDARTTARLGAPGTVHQRVDAAKCLTASEMASEAPAHRANRSPSTER